MSPVGVNQVGEFGATRFEIGLTDFLQRWFEISLKNNNVAEGLK
jgi:hypothetical protein